MNKLISPFQLLFVAESVEYNRLAIADVDSGGSSGSLPAAARRDPSTDTRNEDSQQSATDRR
jgi:hypothetical protein